MVISPRFLAIPGVTPGDVPRLRADDFMATVHLSLTALILAPIGSPHRSHVISEQEFRSCRIFSRNCEFAVKGNVVDLAVGLIIGAAFGKIVSALVDDVIMPPIGMLLGQVDFSDLFISWAARLQNRSRPPGRPERR